MALKDYRIAVGHDVALASLSNVEDLLKPYMKMRIAAPSSPQLERFPEREDNGAGQMRGDGRIDHLWSWSGLYREAVTFLMGYLFNDGGDIVANRPVTIYTPIHDLNISVRYNAYATLFVVGRDYAYRQRKFVPVVLNFTKLIQLA